MGTYLAATEFISEKKSKGEILVFRRGHTPAALKDKAHDEETAGYDKEHDPEPAASVVAATDMIQKQTAIFSWKDVCYDIKVKRGETRRILDHVDGWVKPGTLTALVGVSGAGKTTLLNVLASRVTVGVVSGEMLVDGRQRDSSFQRKTGYVQQQDLHLQTTTVREALNFSALLRQPAHVSRKEKLEYVEEVITLLDMEEYADAIVGVPGEGLNVEQRKRVTIGVELAAKPELLLFLDEPTSGLDSQTSWAICDLMEKLKNSGQAILCTIHQPSAMLFQRFDRLLFLAMGGQTIYFGPVGKNSEQVLSYFERNAAYRCPKDANPAEWIFEVIGAAPGSHSDMDWHTTWRNSSEYHDVHRELELLKCERPEVTQLREDDKESYREFAAPFVEQLLEVTRRVFSQYWRTPSYIYSKVALCLLSSLFIGFVFYKAPVTQHGLQNQMFSIFMLFTIFGQLVQQIMPHFVTQRALYEARERPSKAYSWKAFMFANVTVELPWNALMAVIIFICFYYPIGLSEHNSNPAMCLRCVANAFVLDHNAEPTGEVHLRGLQFFLFVLQFLLLISTFTNMLIAGIEDAELGGTLANIMFMLCLIFCGALVPPQSLPAFWIFMYRVSPLTYLIEGMLSTGVANQRVTCASNEYLRFNAPPGQTCGDYLQPYISTVGGYLNSNTSGSCEFCTYGDTNVFLSSVSASYSHAWRNFGLLWIFIGFNAAMAVFLYWAARVPKKTKSKKKEE
ncbi:Multidrug resistance protein [Vermiconidia calcicola]|uniref:Multidrug resistance protein n=1 Tax=Vermiconidia calcicola TaxID=1690605 RepID=A0ACC3NP63_9PEZI|nr:Multidrug resistance protein [Vermiconidia calcicola]